MSRKRMIRNLKTALLSMTLIILNVLGLVVPPAVNAGTVTTVVNDDDANITYSGNWVHHTNRVYGDYNDDVHYVTTNNSYFQYTFTGTGIEYISEKNSDQGQVGVYIDGTLQTTIDTYNATRLVQQTIYSKLDLTQGSHTIKVVKVSGTYELLDALKVYADDGQAPYGGTARAIPGQIEAEDYDVGGEGIAYHDTTAGNVLGAYRTDDVDIKASTDTGGGYAVGTFAAGEWLEYTVNVATAGTYNVQVRVGSLYAGRTFHIEFNGVDKTGNIAVPQKAAWDTYDTVTVPGVSLDAGQQVMRVVMGSLDFMDFNWIDIVPTCTGVQVGPNDDLDQIVTQYPAGTTYCLAAATYSPNQKVIMEANDQLIGKGPAYTHIDLSGVPVGSVSGAAITWGGQNVAGTGVVDGIDIYDAPVNLNFSPRGCLAAIGGQEHMRILNSHFHNNAWGFAINSQDWYVDGNELDHNGAGDGSGAGHCQGFANGNIKVIHHGDFYNNFIHDNTTTGIWYDVGNATAGGEVAYNTFANNGSQGDVTYEISWGGLDSHDNVHSGGRAYDIESSANVNVHDDDFGNASALIGYGPRALPDSECQQYTTANCNGTMPHDISVDHNSGISEVVTEAWLRSTHSIHDTTWPPNGCQLQDPDGNVIPSVTCTNNTGP